MQQEIKDLIAENHSRRQEIYGPYDPLTGVGCYGFSTGRRKHIVIPDCMIPEMWVPAETLQTAIFYEVLRFGTIKDYITKGMNRNYDADYHLDVEEALYQARFIDDPEFAMYMKALPQVRIVGDVTGGGAGMPFSSSLPNGWVVRFSAVPLYDAQRHSTEFGIVPDTYVALRTEHLKRGKDTIIEVARQLLSK